ncbi:MAG: glycosyltransferase [Flavobacteriales bacterium]|nr:glycosyltransferase [Flavobacteriales bacterium]
MSKRKIVCFGPGPKFKGGISNYNTSLAKTFDKMDDVEVHIVSWTQQYPAIIPREFVDKSSKTDFLEGTNIQVKYITNYNNPASWRATYKYLIELKPEKVIFQWSIAVQGLPLGWLAKRLQKHSDIEVIFDLHFVIQKENSKLDQLFTKYGIGQSDNYIVHAYKTVDELKETFPNKNFKVNETGERNTKNDNTVIKLYHPIYDLFQPDANFDVAAFKQEHKLKKNVFLFFGFIRKYKGLHNLIEAFKLVAEKRDDVSLLICGESFWATLDSTKMSTKVKNAVFGLAKKLFLKKADDEREYNPLALVDSLGLQDSIMVVNTFVPNEDVNKYFQVSDAVCLFYEYATPSGIESLSYNFKLPLLATKVGHFPETIEDGYNGYLAEADNIQSMTEQMIRFIDNPLPRENVAEKTKELSWQNYANAILKA